MIKRRFEYFCDNIENVENYEVAKKDNFKGWHCHHRLQTHTSDGERRLVNISREELKALNMYWHRPAEELIFLRSAEHMSLHQKDKHPSEEARRKNSETHKGQKAWNKGKQLSEEVRHKMSEAKKGKSNAFKGKHWKLVDGKRVWY